MKTMIKEMDDTVVERKYVITTFGAPAILDMRITHADLFVSARSAGFVRIWTDRDTGRVRATCYGESISLGVKSHPDIDEPILESLLNN